MSSNVEIVRRAFDVFARRGEPGGHDAIAELWHDDARFYPLILGEGALEGAVYEGHEGILRFFREEADRAWSELTVELVELRELDESRVLAHARPSAVGERSRARVSADTWFVLTVRDEKIVEARVFAAEAEALAYDSRGSAPEP
jgi:ketosteroid isomerase-like protein